MNIANVIASKSKKKECESVNVTNSDQANSNNDPTSSNEKKNVEIDMENNNCNNNINNDSKNNNHNNNNNDSNSNENIDIAKNTYFINNNNHTDRGNYVNEESNEHAPDYNSAHDSSYDVGNGEYDEDDEEEEVVVLRVCASKHCQGIDNLQFDEETNESYCGKCRAQFARIHDEGFRVLLNEDDLQLVQLIFKKFDRGNKGYWDYKDWAEFQQLTDHPSQDVIDTPLALRDYFRDEFDIELRSLQKGSEMFVVRCSDLENMYGGYLYNNIDALVEDSEALEQEGMIDTAILE